MYKISPWFLALMGSLAAQAGAQTVPLTQNALTNRDVVTLAKAGFNEDFIVDFIHGSQTHFDISVTGLADVAKEGLTERLIRVMLDSAAAPLDRGVPAASPTGTAAAPNGVRASEAPSPETQDQTRVLRRSETAVALVNQTPYHRSFSLLWGLWTRRVEVGSTPQVNSVPQQLGKAYSPVRATNPTPRATRYVVFP